MKFCFEKTRKAFGGKDVDCRIEQNRSRLSSDAYQFIELEGHQNTMSSQ